jgi:hypothetical protein
MTASTSAPTYIFLVITTIWDRSAADAVEIG